MAGPVLHLVDRCITCERPLWQRTIGRLLRNERSGKSVGEVAFVVRTKGPGQGRAWKFERVLPGVPDVLAFAGQGAVDQLRALAIRSFARSWSLGLVTWADAQAVASQVPQAPSGAVPVHHATYGAPAAQGASAAPMPRPQAAPTRAPPPPPPPPPPDRAGREAGAHRPRQRHGVQAMSKPTKKPVVIEPTAAIVHELPMTRLARTLRDTPLGNMFTEDLAAAREHGTATVRVGVAPDGNPVVYARDEAAGRAIGEAIQKRTAVHVLAIPPLTVEQYDVLARGAAERLMPAAPAPVALPAATPHRKGAFRVEVRDADGEEIAASDGLPNVTSAVRWAKAWNDDEGNRGFRARILVMRGGLVVREYDRRRSALKRIV